MNTKETNVITNRIIKGSLAVVVTAVLVVVSRVSGAYLPLELLTALVAFAALAGYATLELREGAPRGINHGLNRRFRREFIKDSPQAEVVAMWRHENERQAA